MAMAFGSPLAALLASCRMPTWTFGILRRPPAFADLNFLLELLLNDGHHVERAFAATLPIARLPSLELGLFRRLAESNLVRKLRDEGGSFLFACLP